MKYAGIAFLMVFVFNSCVTYTAFNIDVLEPADEPVSHLAGNFSILNRTLIDQGDEVGDYKGLYNLTTTETIFALADILSESPAIGFIGGNNMIEMYSPGLANDNLPSLLPARFVDSVLISLNSDAIIVLEQFKINQRDTIEELRARQGSLIYRYYHGTKISEFNVIWHIYFNSPDLPMKTLEFSDSIVWSEAAFSLSDLDYLLPGEEEVAMESAYLAALTFARKIAPYWVMEERLFYSAGNRSLKDAAYFVYRNDTATAKDIYTDMAKSGNRRRRAVATYNLAFINELEGDIDQAIIYARKSLTLMPDKLTADYIDLLVERAEKARELDRQIRVIAD